VSRKETPEPWPDAASKSLHEDRKALIFLHIPKTAGTTLNRIIEWQYSPFAIFTMDPYRIRPTAERLKHLPEARRRRLQVVRGHLFYGIHEFLPQGATYITMLRDPVARVLSAYHFVLRRPLNPLHWKLKRERLGIEDCLRLFPDRHNLQCRFIAGVRDPAIGDERLLEIAKENLTKSFSVVGICERFEESLILISKTFGWEIRFYENQKVAKNRPLVEAKLADLIREHNPLDVELYEFGKKLFEQALREKADAVREGLTILRAITRPGILKRSCQSGISVARFLLNKIVSAI
jgi:Galactose-3-O-sulfotransferase